MQQRKIQKLMQYKKEQSKLDKPLNEPVTSFYQWAIFDCHSFSANYNKVVISLRYPSLRAKTYQSDFEL